MSIIKISELPEATTPLSYTEVTPIVQNNVTSKVALNKILSVNVANFTGTGSQTVFVLPGATTEIATNVYISGVYQQKNSYTVSADTITFSQAPPINASIEVMYA